MKRGGLPVRKWPVRVAALLMLLLLSGCWDRMEVNDIAFVMGTAVDKEDDLYRVSVQFALPAKLGNVATRGSGGGGQKVWAVDTMTGRTLREANQKQQKSLSRQMNFSHRRVFVASEEVAREGLEPVVDILARVPQNRMTSLMAVSKGKAVEILDNETAVEQFPSEMLRELMQSQMRAPTTVTGFISRALEEGIDPVVPALTLRITQPGSQDKPVRVPETIGLGLFRGAKLVTILEGPLAPGLLLAMGQAQAAEMQLIVPGAAPGMVAVRLHESSADLVPLVQGEKITARIRIRAKVALMENTTGEWSPSGAFLDKVKAAMIKRIIQDVEGAFRAAQEAGSDPMGVGAALHRSRPDYWRRIKPTWQRRYREVKPLVEVVMQMEHGGALLAPMSSPNMEQAP